MTLHADRDLGDARPAQQGQLPSTSGLGGRSGTSIRGRGGGVSLGNKKYPKRWGFGGAYCILNYKEYSPGFSLGMAAVMIQRATHYIYDGDQHLACFVNSHMELEDHAVYKQ